MQPNSCIKTRTTVRSNLRPLARWTPRKRDAAKEVRTKRGGSLSSSGKLMEDLLGPHMLLSEKPTQLGWTASLPSSDVDECCGSRSENFDRQTVAEPLLRGRDFELEIEYPCSARTSHGAVCSVSSKLLLDAEYLRLCICQ
jgi:hypothetical protein